MANLVKKVFVMDDFLSNEEASQFRQFTDTLPINKPSFVFNTVAKTEEHNEEVRKSQTVILDDPNVLQFIKEKILGQFTKTHSDLVVKLARDHVTFIKYQKGGFFDWHKDHEKFKINNHDQWIEGHLIYCIQPAVSGGQLQIKRDGEIETFDYKANQCVIFDKSMEHRAQEVTEGKKIIMTVDVLISTKEIQNDPNLDLQLVEALKNPVGFRSYNLEKIKKLYQPDQHVMFGIIKTKNTYLSRTVIYDSLGCYHKTDEDESWTRTTSVCKPQEFDSEGFSTTMDESHHWGQQFFDYAFAMVLQGDEQEIVKGEVTPHQFKSTPIPLGTDIQLLLDTICCHPPATPEMISYTYHCNESNYEEHEIEHTYGLINLSALTQAKPNHKK
jgi:predicted 2-oxoglutarate/Fe(II)-dependent dioxygenase YbiX